MPHGYLVALFDILGFEQLLASVGLKEMLARYEALIEVVNYRKEQIRRVFGDMGFSEAPYWTAERDVSIFNEVHGAYASDSILLWTNRTWPEARDSTIETCNALAKNPSNGWAYQPIPCDNFLDVCNDLVCRGLEVGLPLRGAISIGDAIFDGNRNIFLGQPIVEAARLESGQRLIGASFCKSAMAQTIPKRFSLNLTHHIKDGYEKNFGGISLDWPRHWRKTRVMEVANIINAMNTDERYSLYYRNTLDLVEHSQGFASKFESLEETSIRTVYEAFSWSNKALSIKARAVRRVPIERDT